MAKTPSVNAKAFYKYVDDRYKGKVFRIERSTSFNPANDKLIVRVEFHLPAPEMDEIEVFRRINRVLEVIADGEE